MQLLQRVWTIEVEHQSSTKSLIAGCRGIRDSFSNAILCFINPPHLLSIGPNRFWFLTKDPVPLSISNSRTKRLNLLSTIENLCGGYIYKQRAPRFWISKKNWNSVYMLYRVSQKNRQDNWNHLLLEFECYSTKLNPRVYKRLTDRSKFYA